MSTKSEQYEKLVAAALNCSGYAEGKYVKEGAPRCVIGHLAVSEGVSVEFLEAINDQPLWSLDSLPYPSEYNNGGLLSWLQDVWDGHFCKDLTTDEARMAMLFEIESVYA